MKASAAPIGQLLPRTNWSKIAGAIIVADDGRKHFAPAVRFRDEPSQPLYREPLLGEHTDEILRGGLK